MLRPYDLLENVLIDIEKGIRKGVCVDILAKKYRLSYRHLQRLFKFAFKQSLASYIRSRRLAASLDDLLKTDSKILNIALDYGFDYEQSYIGSFKREFGITPGDLRKSGQIIKITPPLQLFDSNRLGDGLIFGPEIVMVQQFHVIGKKQKWIFRDALYNSSINYLSNYEKSKIPNKINPDVLICISGEAEKDADYFWLMKTVQVKSLEYIPEGFEGFTFPASLCAKFHYIGSKPELCNMYTGDDMFHTIDNFMDNNDQQYFLERKRINFDKLDISDNYIQWEWLAPVIKKTTLKFSPHNPSGIKNIYKQQLPALRFIGKKYTEPPEPKKILNLLNDWQLNSWFDIIERKAGCEPRFSDAYISLVREKDAAFEHWMGVFMPKETEVPYGFEAIDFPEMTIYVCSVYGKRGEIINYEKECRNKLTEEGFSIKNTHWYFMRFNWHGFFADDIYGKRSLDYCFLIM